MRRAPWLLPLVALVACVASDQPPSPGGSTARVGPAPIPLAHASASQQAQERLPVGMIEPEFDLDHLRDPFARIMPKDDTIDPERHRDASLAETPVEDLRVRGTVSAGLTGYAILANDRGETAVVPLGKAVGAEIKDGKARYDWRLDRVRDGEVILRGDASNGASKTFRVKAAQQGWKT